MLIHQTGGKYVSFAYIKLYLYNYTVHAMHWADLKSLTPNYSPNCTPLSPITIHIVWLNLTWSGITVAEVNSTWKVTSKLANLNILKGALACMKGIFIQLIGTIKRVIVMATEVTIEFRAIEGQHVQI